MVVVRMVQEGQAIATANLRETEADSEKERERAREERERESERGEERDMTALAEEIKNEW